MTDNKTADSSTRLSGLIGATYTPMNDDGSIRFDQIGPMVDRLEKIGISGIYICGSTGEGINMTTDERKQVAEAYVEHARGRLKTIVHVGHNSLAEARGLATHAKSIGADIFSAVAPSYFKAGTADQLVDIVEHVASAAPDLPFYYYHIPPLTGIQVDPAEFLELAADRIPNLAGVKYTMFTVHDFQSCCQVRDGRFDIVWGFDEMLLSGLAAGARAAIGSTFSLVAPLYIALMEAFEKGDIEKAREYQALSVNMIRCFYSYPFHPAVKAILTRLGIPSGPCRLPLPRISEEQADELWEKLAKVGAHDWFEIS